MNRPRGMSARWKLTLSYAGFLIVAGALLLATVWVFLLRYVPDEQIIVEQRFQRQPGASFVPNRSDLQEAFTPRAFQAMGALVVVGLVGGWLLAGRMLAPLKRITAATRTAAQGSLSHRIAMEGRQDEFRELADSFDAMLAQLEAHVAEHQRFAANASHELRTPLAVTQTLLDVAAQDPDHDQDDLITRLRVVNTRAIDLTESLLTLSRATQTPFSQETLDLSLAAEEAVETLLPLAEGHDVTITMDGDAAPAAGSASLILQVATNLVHNAIVHNRPLKGTVHVTTWADADTATLTVENTGGVISSATIATLTEPFHRESARVRSEHDGVGLGLAIVSSIVRAHRGTLTITPRSGGGLRVTASFPRADEASPAPDATGGHPRSGGHPSPGGSHGGDQEG